MDLYQYILIAFGAIIIITTVSVVLLKKEKNVFKDQDLESIFDLFDIDNINTIEFVRNKIVINFIDVNLFNVEELHNKGALGISIVGDKVKFYFDGGNEKNLDIYNQLKKYIEG